jgi:rubrerythrin
MSRLRNFVEGAGSVAAAQESILNAMENIFDPTAYAQLEAAILAPGLEGWESRALVLIKSAVGENFAALQADVDMLKARYKKAVPYPGQEQDFWVDELKKPHLRVYFCLKCGYRVSSMALSGICCHGAPPCPRCKHELHEPNCRKRKQKEASGAEGNIPTPES